MKPELPEGVREYAEWHKAAYGWNPFEPLACLRCRQPVFLIEVFRCYDCGAAMHRDCLKEHCAESRGFSLKQALDGFEWGESGDPLWEARDAGWGGAVLRAYERGLLAGKPR